MTAQWQPIRGRSPAVACVYAPNLTDLQRAVRERGFTGLTEQERDALLALPWDEFNRLVQMHATTARRPSP